MLDWQYALACVVVPAVVGAVMYGAFELWDRQRRRGRTGEGLPVVDYSI
jgi:hypothetical protein